MESIFGFENMARETVVSSMIQDYEKELQETARVAHMLKQSEPIRPAWYAPLLVRLGNALVSIGTRFNAHYSTSPRLRTREPERSLKTSR
jgi:hypothetical protein